MVCEKLSKTDFQDGGCGGHLGFLITIFAHFDPVATEQVSAKTDQRFGKRCRKLIFKMAAVAAILNFQSAQF